MLHGHGDDLYAHPDIAVNFSSNVYNGFNHNGLFDHLSRHLSAVTHYPAPTASRLEAALARHLNLTPEQVMVTSGATEAIYLVAQAYGGGRSCILTPTFAEYADACRIHHHTVTERSVLTGVPCPELLADEKHSDLIWLCNPSNPLGTTDSPEQMRHLARHHAESILVIDASYAPFTDQPLLSPAEAVTLPNVLMLHSMTKRFAVPGLRLGFVTACATLLQRLRGLQMPWSIGSLAQEAGLYLLEHEQDYPLPLALLRQESQRVAEAFREMGIDVHSSHTHILLCQLPQGTAAALKEYLIRHHNILIRDAANFHGLTPAHFRIAVQSPQENDELLAAVADYLNAKS